jgi:type IV secretion system protein VirB2
LILIIYKEREMEKKLILFVVLLLLTASAVFASGESMPWDDGLTKVKNALSGNTALTIGIILTIGAGIAVAFTEGQALKKVFWVVIGLGIALNAAILVSRLFGTSSGLLL